ncbi:MAG: molybdopterin dinucleotide binding domain-containing protein, partial [Gordonia sp. (in: high G+C Gram-positive bacteria)]
RRDAGGALRVSVADAERLGLDATSRVRITTEAGSLESSIEISEMMRAGHVSLPNGLGIDYPGADGVARSGIAPNELTSATHRDWFAGTPWHKYVPARIEPITT